MQNPTPQTPQYELVAYISKTKGLDGQLVAHELGELSVLRPQLEVWVVPPALEGARHTTIANVVLSKQKQGVLINLEGVDDRTEASGLVGKHLLARISDIKGHGKGKVPVPSTSDGVQEPSSSFHDDAFESSEMSFIDAVHGMLGQLDSIKQGPAYDIWVIEGPFGRLEIPAVDEYVVSEEQDTINLALPKGFIEITKQQGRSSQND